MAPRRTIQSLSRHLLSQSGRKVFVGEAGSSRSTKVFGRFHPSEIQIGRWRCVPRWVFTPLAATSHLSVSNVTIFFCGSIGYGSRSLMVSSHTSDAPNSEQPKTGTTQACPSTLSFRHEPAATAVQAAFTERATAATM
ncbi:hypothetical protein NEUTE2DRAFT_124435 [Neurospora tetrasperma FGSC 2509]|nr:hypothetical protein NEUTE2DRAFT_124435 [Neurospora tetrasperma FGSC 2509]